MQATLQLKCKDGSVVVIHLSEISSKEVWKSLKMSLVHDEFIRLKQTILFNQLKYSIKQKNYTDPFGDLKLLKRETATYFKQSGAKVTKDKDAIGDFCLCVETDMFGGTHKHISQREYMKV